MATDKEFIEYVCEQIRETGEVTYKKMFGEYMAYVNAKPVLLVCDNTVYVKQVDAIQEFMQDAEKGIPYKGAKEHYILDIDDSELSENVVKALEKVTPLPKPRKKK
ncbi:MAG: TfoX/Sxy family protein [Clostridia bacterium]|nr:TfoX/Sxy family protein [Clostridia bacterium]